MKLSKEQIEKTELRNNRIGNTGSAARSSTVTKATNNTTAPMNRPTIIGDD